LGEGLLHDRRIVAQTHSADHEFLLEIRPRDGRPSLLEWAADQRELLRGLLLRHCGVLFRGFADPTTPGEFARFLEANSDGELLEYTQGSTPREIVSGRVATATAYPADREIPLHNELSYARAWPLKLAFQCRQAPLRGGATPLADSRRVFANIDPLVRQRFADHGVMYVRNYRELVDVPWQQAFLTDDRAAVESYCRKTGIEFEWLEGNDLKTTQVCQATALHPETGDSIWFNQAHLFHISNLPRATGDRLLRLFGEENLPRNAYFGDGAAIDEADLASVRAAYQRERIRFDWQEGDVLLIDNMLAAHGRESFEGERMVWVGMTDSHSPDPTLARSARDFDTEAEQE
jgi:alpha-ketoglutarate-dependent taurine dioxygenase